MYSKKNVFSLLLICMFFISTGSLYAKSNLHIGTMTVEPFVSVEHKYDDNIFLEPENQTDSDWITKSTVGVTLDKKREEDYSVKATYTLDSVDYWDYHAQNRIDHTVKATADFRFMNNLHLKLKDNFTKTGDRPNSEITRFEKRIRNLFNPVVGYAGETIKFDLGYKVIRDDYSQTQTLDKYEHVVVPTVYYQILPKTSVFCEYNYGEILYDTQSSRSNSDYHQVFAGIKGEITSKLTGIIKTGYKDLDYEAYTEEDFKGSVTTLILNYALQERTNLKLMGEMGTVESSYTNNSFFEKKKVRLDVKHQLTDTLSFKCGGEFQINEYPRQTTEDGLTDKRDDDIWGGSAALCYDFDDWLSVEAGYEYKERDSVFATYDYEENQYMIKAKVLI